MPGSIPARHSGVEALQQALGLVAALGGGQLQPVAGLQRLAMARLAVEPAEFQLGSPVTGAGGLAQQLQADAAIAGVAAVAAQQLAQPALGNDHAFTGWALEQASGETLDAGVVPQAGTIEEPGGQTSRQVVIRIEATTGQNARLHVSKGWLRGAPLYSLFLPGKDLPNPANRALEQLLGKSTEAVDNSVDNLVETFLTPRCPRLRVKLVLFSPMKKFLIFH